jgi:hypothetical protein
MTAEKDKENLAAAEAEAAAAVALVVPSVPIPYVEWTVHHEKILIDWADKASCYKWLHEKSNREFSRKSRWFTIPVIIMSTLTGTANFAQDRIPSEYLSAATMVIGGINLIAGVITTIQQFLKINELNESHRVSAISWGKFQRNLFVELAKAPAERTHASHLIKVAKEEYDRLIETGNSIPTHIIKKFKETFSGGEIKYDASFNKLPLTNKQQVYFEISKPEICDSIESMKRAVYKPTKREFEAMKITQANALGDKLHHGEIELANKKSKLEDFIFSFEKETSRLPTTDEIIDNIEGNLSLEIIETVLSELETSHKRLGVSYA